MQETQKYKRLSLLFFSLLFCLPCLLLLDIFLGSSSISISKIIQELCCKTDNLALSLIVWEIRVPRAITAVIVGFSLSLSGLLMQTLFRNPLAGPSVLGVSSGASVGVAFVMLFVGTSLGSHTLKFSIHESWILIFAASLGSIAILFLILFVSLYLNDTVAVLIVGIMLANFTLSIVSIWQFFSNPEEIQTYLLWTFGSLQGVLGYKLLLLAILNFCMAVVAVLFAKNLNLLLFGTGYAASCGVHVPSFTKQIILVTGILAGSVTAFCGPIGFIGVVVPHIARLLTGTSDHRYLLPITALLGAIIMLVCDCIAKLPGYEHSLPINAVTSIVGTPIVLVVLLKRKNIRI